jgi:hypothetical protein
MSGCFWACRRSRGDGRFAGVNVITGDDTEQGQVLTALAQLNPSERDALVLFDWEGLSGQQAARALGLRRATYLVRLHRARHHLLREVTRQAEERDSRDRPPQCTCGRVALVLSAGGSFPG